MPNITTKVGTFVGDEPGDISGLTETRNSVMTNPTTLDAALTDELLDRPYSAEELATMNENDKIYAYRVSEGIADR